MSAARNRRTRRRQKGSQRKRNRRLVSAEPLEPRVVLDGSGLGVISPDFLATIPITDNDTQWFGAVEIAGDPAAERSNSLFDTNLNRPWIPDFRHLLRSDAFFNRIADRTHVSYQIFVRPHEGRGSLVDGSSDFLFALRQDTGGQLRQTVDASESVAETSPKTSNTGDTVVLSAGGSTSSVVRLAEPVQRHGAAASRGASMVDSGALTRGSGISLVHRDASVTIADPGVISLPDPEPGFLPAQSSPVEPDLRSIATVEQREVEGTSKQAESPQVASRGGPRGPEGVDRAAALSRDQYFARHTARGAVDWTTQSSSSAWRQHVDTGPQNDRYASNHASSAPEAVRLSWSPFALAALLGSASIDVLDGTTAATPRLGATLEVLADIAAVPQRPTDLSVSVARENEPLAGQSNQECCTGDLWEARYQPVSILVGVSLVSAHVIADSRQSNPKRDVRAFKRRFRGQSGVSK